MGVLLGSDVVQLNDVAAFVAALDGTLAGDLVHPISILRFSIRASSSTYGEPVNLVRVNGVASATGVLLITGTVDNDGVFEGSYMTVR